MSADASKISDDLERVVCRVENGHLLAVDFCDRLTRSLALLFGVAEASCSDADRVAFDRILVRIVPGATEGARRFLSGRLADSLAPPRTVLLFLANDVIAIARPILERSPALGEDDLVEIARTHGPGHMSAIALRADLGIRVTDVLVLRGDDEVRRIVAGNIRAHVSDKSFARLSLQARADAIVEARLVGRGDLPDVVVRFLVENGSPGAREALLARDASTRTQRGLAAGTAPILAAEDGWLDAYDFDEAARVLSQMKEVRGQVDGFLRRLAQTDRFPEIVHVAAAVTGIRLETMKHLFVSLDTEPFAVIARALSLKVDTVRELLVTGPWLHRLNERARDATVTLYRSLDPDEARARVRQWIEQDARDVA